MHVLMLTTYSCASHKGPYHDGKAEAALPRPLESPVEQVNWGGRGGVGGN